MVHISLQTVPIGSASRSLACRRLEAVENQTEQLGRAVADSREVDGLREDAFKDRLTAIDKSVRDVSRTVQLVRDKQVRFQPLMVRADDMPLMCTAAFAQHLISMQRCRSWLVPKQSWQRIFPTRYEVLYQQYHLPGG